MVMSRSKCGFCSKIRGGGVFFFFFTVIPNKYVRGEKDRKGNKNG